MIPRPGGWRCRRTYWRQNGHATRLSIKICRESWFPIHLALRSSHRSRPRSKQCDRSSHRSRLLLLLQRLGRLRWRRTDIWELMAKMMKLFACCDLGCRARELLELNEAIWIRFVLNAAVADMSNSLYLQGGCRHQTEGEAGAEATRLVVGVCVGSESERCSFQLKRGPAQGPSACVLNVTCVYR